VRDVRHAPVQPKPDVPVLVTARVAEGITKATLKLQAIAPGKYDLEWSGTGPDVQLNIRKGSETVATAPAKIKPVATASAGTGYSTKAEGDGSKLLTSVFIAGKKYTIELGSEVAAAPAKATDTAGNN